MTATSHPEFHTNTEAIEVAAAFPDRVKGKTVIVTGVNCDGVGFGTAEAFASQDPAHLIITGRSLAKLTASIDALKARYPNVDYRPLVFDLSSQKSVRAAADELLSWSDVPAVDIIVNSAAVMNLPERVLSADGIEMQFATNHIGHYLFTCLIMPKLIASASSAPGSTRVVNVSSLSATWSNMRWSDINQDKINKTLPEAEQPNYDVARAWGTADPEELSYIPLEGYNQSKVANVLFGIALTRRVFDKFKILSVAMHPGLIKTELSRSATQETLASIEAMREAGIVVYRTQGAGASTSLVAALDPKLGPAEEKEGKQNYGSYLTDCQISLAACPLAESSEEAEKLWKLSEELVGEKFAW